MHCFFKATLFQTAFASKPNRFAKAAPEKREERKLEQKKRKPDQIRFPLKS
jgi:hypothetical protein